MEKNEKKIEMSFEAALERLEVIVKSLETGRAPLDESLTLFEEGVALVRFCNGKLDLAEKKVKILTEPDGDLRDFAPSSEPSAE